jgi:hypothetical protein
VLNLLNLNSNKMNLLQSIKGSLKQIVIQVLNLLNLNSNKMNLLQPIKGSLKQIVIQALNLLNLNSNKIHLIFYLNMISLVMGETLKINVG